ncbi:hypothetical protein Tco_0420568 [Tanacetum coccineum]
MYAAGCCCDQALKGKRKKKISAVPLTKSGFHNLLSKKLKEDYDTSGDAGASTAGKFPGPMFRFTDS